MGIAAERRQRWRRLAGQALANLGLAIATLASNNESAAELALGLGLGDALEQLARKGGAAERLEATQWRGGLRGVLREVGEEVRSG